MTTFLVDKGTAYSYEDLLLDINHANDYRPQFKSDDLYRYFINLLLALIHNKPLVLIDSDLNFSEIDKIDMDLINLSESINKTKISSISEMISKIESSKSEITLFTSGTTGQPKKVIHTVNTLIRNTRISSAYKDNIWAFAYNPTHMAGLQVFFQAFMNSNVIVNVFNKSRDEVYNLIDHYKVTHISSTPTFYRLLLPLDKICSYVTRVTFGGEKSDSKLYSTVEQIFPKAKINNIYASTEAGALFSAKGEFFKIPSSIQNKIKVIDNELYVHHSLLGKSENFKFNDENYYCTGDLIEWEDQENGLFRFKGRSNELINVGGYKVNPLEIESVISQLPDIIQVVVYGKSNSVLGNLLCADIKLKEDSCITELSMRDYLKGLLQDFKIPRRIKFVDTIELTRTGKLKRV